MSHICSLTLLTAEVVSSQHSCCSSSRDASGMSQLQRHASASNVLCQPENSSDPTQPPGSPLVHRRRLYLVSREALQEPTAEPTDRKCSAFEQEIKPGSPTASPNSLASLLQSVSRESLHPLWAVTHTLWIKAGCPSPWDVITGSWLGRPEAWQHLNAGCRDLKTWLNQLASF